MVIEALVNLKNVGDEQNYEPGDILVIREKDSFWGTGDLQSRAIVQIEIGELPCGIEWGSKKCVKCEHHGIAWDTDTPSIGDIGRPKISCQKEQYEVEDNSFAFTLNPQGIPVLEVMFNKRRLGKVKIEEILSPESIAAYVNEKSVTKEKRDEKLAIARKPSNLLTVDNLAVK